MVLRCLLRSVLGACKSMSFERLLACAEKVLSSLVWGWHDPSVLGAISIQMRIMGPSAYTDIFRFFRHNPIILTRIDEAKNLRQMAWYMGKGGTKQGQEGIILGGFSAHRPRTLDSVSQGLLARSEMGYEKERLERDRMNQDHHTKDE